MLKYVTEFISQDPEKDVMTFLLTVSKLHWQIDICPTALTTITVRGNQASAIGMLFKRSVKALPDSRRVADGADLGSGYFRGATISAAEGGCMAEVGVATSCAAAGFTAIMGGTPQQILQAAE